MGRHAAAVVCDKLRRNEHGCPSKSVVAFSQIEVDIEIFTGHGLTAELELLNSRLKPKKELVCGEINDRPPAIVSRRDVPALKEINKL